MSCGFHRLTAKTRAAPDLGASHRSPDNGRMATLPTTLTLGPLTVDVPVVLAPMAGITNAAYRRLCAEQGAGLYVCEMITSRGLVEGDQHTRDTVSYTHLTLPTNREV